MEFETSVSTTCDVPEPLCPVNERSDTPLLLWDSTAPVRLRATVWRSGRRVGPGPGERHALPGPVCTQMARELGGVSW